MSPKNFFSKNRKSYWWRHFFGLGVSLELCRSRSRSQNWDRDRSWSRKNFAVSVSVLVSDESVSTTALMATFVVIWCPLFEWFGIGSQFSLRGSSVLLELYAVFCFSQFVNLENFCCLNCLHRYSSLLARTNWLLTKVKKLLSDQVLAKSE